MCRVRYTENKAGKTQATLLTLTFLIPGDNNLSTLSQVPSSIYVNLFGIKKYPSENTYLVTNLLPLSIGCTFVPFSRNITGPNTNTAIPTQRTVIEKLDSL